MGFWKTERGVGGDSWVDAMDRLMKELPNYKAEVLQMSGERRQFDPPHEITMAEFADLVEFCSRGHLSVELRHPEDGDRRLSELHSDGVKTHNNRGQIHCAETCPVCK